MSEDIYQAALLEHAKNPNNAELKESCRPFVAKRNNLCGDSIVVGRRWGGGKIAEACFQGTGCAVMLASASVMTELVRSKTIEEVQMLVQSVERFMKQTGEGGALPPELAMFNALQAYPARHRCVLLPWEGLLDALKDS